MWRCADRWRDPYVDPGGDWQVVILHIKGWIQGGIPRIPLLFYFFSQFYFYSLFCFFFHGLRNMVMENLRVSMQQTSMASGTSALSPLIMAFYPRNRQLAGPSSWTLPLLPCPTFNIWSYNWGVEPTRIPGMRLKKGMTLENLRVQ